MPARPRRAAVVAGTEPATSPSLMSEAPAPMLCTLIDHAFDGPDWAFEPKFDGLRILARLDDPAEIRRRMEKHPAFFYVFDILHLDGTDLGHLPLSARREKLRRAVAWSDRIRPTESVDGKGVETLRRACEAGEEGIVGKR